MAFHWLGTQLPTLDAFRQYLDRQAVPAWAKGVTIHHTWKPVPSSWRGLASMDGLRRHYRDTMKWSAGPHLFLCIGAPNPAHDGIFIGTPLDTPGIHAGVCNSTRWGVEIVGNFDAEPWAPDLEDLVYGVILALSSFGNFKPETVNGHRECLPNKSCPGDAIDMDAVRLEARRRNMPNYVREWGTLPYHPTHGVETKWREHYRELGPCIKTEAPLIDGRRYAVFRDGFIDWSEQTGARVYRRQP